MKYKQPVCAGIIATGILPLDYMLSVMPVTPCKASTRPARASTNKNDPVGRPLVRYFEVAATSVPLPHLGQQRHLI
jgi:hypothetical protein